MRRGVTSVSSVSVQVDNPASPIKSMRFSIESGLGNVSRWARTLLAIVDTGPLFAAVDRESPSHAVSVEVLLRGDITPVVPTMVVAEATYLVGSRLGSKAEAAFLRSITELEIEAPLPSDWRRIADLVDQYADLRLGGTDATVIATAERLGATKIITLDRKHFSVVRPKHIEAFELLPT